MIDKRECVGLVQGWGTELIQVVGAGLIIDSGLLCWGFAGLCPEPPHSPKWNSKCTRFIWLYFRGLPSLIRTRTASALSNFPRRETTIFGASATGSQRAGLHGHASERPSL